MPGKLKAFNGRIGMMDSFAGKFHEFSLARRAMRQSGMAGKARQRWMISAATLYGRKATKHRRFG